MKFAHVRAANIFTAKLFHLPEGQISLKKALALERHSKGQFYKNTVYLERGMPYFCICGHKCSACQEN